MIISLPDLKRLLGITSTNSSLDDVYTQIILNVQAQLERYLKTKFDQQNYSDIFYIIPRYQERDINLDLGLNGLYNISNLVVTTGSEKSDIAEPITSYILNKTDGVITIYGTPHSAFYKVEYTAGFPTDVNGIYTGIPDGVLTALLAGVKHTKKECSGSNKEKCKDNVLFSIFKRSLYSRDLYNTRGVK